MKFLMLLLSLVLFVGCASKSEKYTREELSVFEKIFAGKLEHFSYKDTVRDDLETGSKVYGAVLYLHVRNANGKLREFFKIAEDDYEIQALAKIRDSLKVGQSVKINLGLFDGQEVLEPFDSIRIL